MFENSKYEGMELSTQIVIDSALKRGINVEILDKEDNFISLEKNGRTEYLKQATKTSLDKYITPLIMENKHVTKKILEKDGFPVPKGKRYFLKENAKSEYGKYSNMPIVIKPVSTNFGIGITTLEKGFTEEQFNSAIDFAFDHDSFILIEQFISGTEYRFLIIGDKVTAILERVPANVKGDGTHTIRELIEIKNQDPIRGTGYKKPLEKIKAGTTEKEFLKAQGLNFESIPKKDQVIYLRKNSNISTGGDSIDHTDAIPDRFKKLVLNAVGSVGAVICGADLIIEDINGEANEDNCSIIELNFNPALHIHNFPAVGNNRHTEEDLLNLLGY